MFIEYVVVFMKLFPLPSLPPSNKSSVFYSVIKRSFFDESSNNPNIETNYLSRKNII